MNGQLEKGYCCFCKNRINPKGRKVRDPHKGAILGKQVAIREQKRSKTFADNESNKREKEEKPNGGSKKIDRTNEKQSCEKK